MYTFLCFYVYTYMFICSFIFVMNSYILTLCPVVTCPYLCALLRLRPVDGVSGSCCEVRSGFSLSKGELHLGEREVPECLDPGF